MLGDMTIQRMDKVAIVAADLNATRVENSGPNER
jgi:hypothetical protein